jgi:hypothetical protein
MAVRQPAEALGIGAANRNEITNNRPNRLKAGIRNSMKYQEITLHKLMKLLLIEKTLKR